MALCIGVQVWNLLGITRFATNRFVLSPTFIQRMLDGFQWRPLADQWSYDECTQRILQFFEKLITRLNHSFPYFWITIVMKSKLWIIEARCLRSHSLRAAAGLCGQNTLAILKKLNRLPFVL